MALEYYFQGGIDLRWQEEIARCSTVKIFSPYLTSETALMVLENIPDAKKCDIYTRFSEEDFVNGSSSIMTLRQLFSVKHNLYAICNLHAKLIIIPDKLVSIGSQNLTVNGTRNLEANLIITDLDEICKIEQEINHWLVLNQPIPITDEMLEEMEKKVKPLREQYQNILDIIKSETSILERHTSITDANPLAEDKPFRFPTIRRARERVSAKVKKITDKRRINQEGSYSLLAERQSSLTKWQIEGEPVELLPDHYRYLCLNLREGRCGWGRLGETRITFIENRIKWPNIYRHKGYEYSFSFEFKNYNYSNLNFNLVVQIDFFDSDDFDFGQIFLKCDFSVNNFVNYLKIKRYKCLPENAPLLKDILSRKGYYKNQILKLLTRPFKFQAGQRLVGDYANTFFGDEGTEYNLSLGKILDNYIIIAE